MLHALVLGLATLAVAGDASPPLTLEETLARQRPGLAEARLATELAGLEVELAQTSGRWLDGPTFSPQLGWRRQEGGGDAADVALELSLPLASKAARESREALAASLAQNRELLGRAARRGDRQELVEAYLALWGAQQRLARRRAETRLLEDFALLLERRIEAGAAAAFEAGLAAAELAAARGLAADAAAEERASWARVLGLADLPPEPIPTLKRPSFAGAAAAARPDEGLPAAGVAAETGLAAARAGFEFERELSRAALGASLAREGDEEVVLFGFSWRPPRAGERAARERQAELAAARRETESRRRRAELAARAERSQARLALIAATGEANPADSAQTGPGDAVWRAAELRVREGKDSPGAALSLRRTLIAAQLTAIELELRRLEAQAELAYLSEEKP